MSAADLLSAIRRRNMNIWVEGDRLRFDAPAGAMTADLRAQIQRHKPEIVAYLKSARQWTQPHCRTIPRVPRDARLPLSYAQWRLWFMAQLVPDSPLYNVPAAPRLEGMLDRAALRWSLQQLVRRHEILRTTFHEEDGEPFQRIGEAGPMELPVVDLSHLPEAGRGDEARRLAAAESQRRFDLSSGPLLRARLLRLEDEQHILVLTMHHIVSDGWSMGVLIRELGEFYRAFRLGQPPALPKLSIQYVDFAAWQRQWLQGEVLDSLLRSWTRKLADLPTLRLPTDRARPKVQTFRGARQWTTLSSAPSDALREFSRKEGVTLFMAMLAAFEVLLHRYSGQDDMVVGTPVANRNRAEVERLIGAFANTVVVRTDLSGDPTFRELLGRVRDVALEAYECQDVPFEKLVEALEPERDLSRNPLFQVSFALHSMPPPPTEWGGVRVTLSWAETLATRYDLEVHVWDDPDGMRIMLVHSTDLFDSRTIEQMMGHYQTLLKTAVEHPDQQISRLSMMEESERHQWFHRWNETATDYQRDRCLHELFEARSARSPDAVAVVFEAEQLTYRQLNARSNQLARHLRTLGVGPEVMVGLCVERSLEMVVGLLGILKAGGAYVPLDPSHPPDRLASMLADARPPVLVTHSSLVDKLPEHDAKLVCLDADWPNIALSSSRNPSPIATPDNLAYVIYTSGSTGKPNGVLVSHANVTRLFRATDAWFHFDHHDVWTLFHSFAFDFSVWEIWGALLHGGRLVVVPYLVSRSPEAFHDLLCTHQVTVLNQTPSAFYPLLRVDAQAGDQKKTSLRLIIFGGETLDVSRLVPWFERHGDQFPRLVNMYGITETTVHVTYRRLTRADTGPSPGSAIGRPIPDMQVRVLDAHGQPVPIGVRGEMYIGGAGVARGYLNRPELSAERFVALDPGSSQAARWYKSGDLARWRADGELEYMGRGDQQIQLRGFRVELPEIEMTLRQHPAVGEAAVLLRQTSADDQRLVAYVVPAEGRPPSPGELRAHLTRTLPNYMVPSTLVILPFPPLTPNGKLDRNALPAPDGERQLDEAFVSPRTETERRIADIWRQVLQIQRIGVHDNFFELGGHSLLAVRLVSRLSEAWSLALPLRCIFEYPTTAELATYVDALGCGTASAGELTAGAAGPRVRGVV